MDAEQFARLSRGEQERIALLALVYDAGKKIPLTSGKLAAIDSTDSLTIDRDDNFARIFWLRYRTAEDAEKDSRLAAS